MSIPNSDATTINSAFSMLLAAMVRLLRSTSLAFCSSEYSGTVKNPLKKANGEKIYGRASYAVCKKRQITQKQSNPDRPDQYKL